MDRDELRELVAGLRAYLEAASRSGVYAVPGGASPRVGGALPVDVDRATGEDPDSRIRPAQAAESQAESPASRRATLGEVRAELGDCQRCKLADRRQNIVFGVGSETAALMFVGEAPGAEEDRRGEPFVGRAGQLLDQMIAAMGWTRESVYIANVLKCRPPGNRDPQHDEVAACESFLAKQIDAIRPRVIVTLGKPAAHLVLRTRAPISALRGRWQEYRGTRVMPTFHPAYLLRQPERKREAWSDLKAVIAEIDRLGIDTPRPPRT